MAGAGTHDVVVLCRRGAWVRGWGSCCGGGCGSVVLLRALAFVLAGELVMVKQDVDFLVETEKPSKNIQKQLK